MSALGKRGVRQLRNGDLFGRAYSVTPTRDALRLSDDIGSVMRVWPKPAGWEIITADVPKAMRGQGHGIALYEEIIRLARQAGSPRILSDTVVSPDAARVYESLRRRGYSVRDGGDVAQYEIKLT